MAKDFVLFNGPYNLVAAEAVAANHLVTLDTDGKAALTGATGIPVAFTYDAVASGALGAFEEIKGKMLLTASASIAIGDYVKAGAGGTVVPETTATTPTVFTIGQAITAVTTSGAVYVVAR